MYVASYYRFTLQVLALITKKWVFGSMNDDVSVDHRVACPIPLKKYQIDNCTTVERLKTRFFRIGVW